MTTMVILNAIFAVSAVAALVAVKVAAVRVAGKADVPAAVPCAEDERLAA